MKMYRYAIMAMYLVSIIAMLIFIITHVVAYSFIGYGFLFIASVNMLIVSIMDIKKKRQQNSGE